MSFDASVISDDSSGGRGSQQPGTTDSEGKPIEAAMSNNDPLVLQQRAINMLEARLRQAQASAQAAKDEVRLLAGLRLGCSRMGEYNAVIALLLVCISSVSLT